MKRVSLMLACVLMFLIAAPVSLASNDSPINILLLGTDNFGAQVGENEEMSRADAIYVISIHPGRKSIKLLSIERDYLAVLPDDLGENKLGTVTYFGGPEMAMHVINEMFDLDIELFAHIDIYNLISAIDIFGGVYLDVLPEEVEEVNAFISGILIEQVPPLSSGINHLNGLQTWSFMGVRNHDMDPIESNVQRNARQQRVLAAVLEQAGQKDLSVIMTLVGEVLPLVTTNISTAELFKIIDLVLNSDLDHIDYQRTPASTYKMKRVNMHRVVVPDNMDEEIKLIRLFLEK